jgi:sugar/nucleoside kinase (ribokinase family)
LDYTRLISFLKKPKEVGYPVVLPDFFLDHFVLIESLEKLIEGLERLAGQGGGNLLENEQFIRKGGNAVNTASALYSLGLMPKLIVTTDEHGKALLRAMASPEIDYDHVQTRGRLSSTVSIETKYKGRKVNLMISDSGSAREFGFSDLTDSDIKAICGCSLVALVNLNHNLKGSELAHDLFEFVKESSNAITFMDMGDPSGNPELVGKLVRKVMSEGLVDVFGLNENEVRWVANSLSGSTGRWQDIQNKPLQWLKAAEFVSTETSVRIDLHTPYYTSTVDKGATTSVPVFEVESRVVCGAGDAWNAGTVYGTLLELEPIDRLTLANAVAALYISSSDASHPSLTDIVMFLASNPPLSGDGTKLLKS